MKTSNDNNSGGIQAFNFFASIGILLYRCFIIMYVFNNIVCPYLLDNIIKLQYMHVIIIMLFISLFQKFEILDYDDIQTFDYQYNQLLNNFGKIGAYTLCFVIFVIIKAIIF
ncbi:MAG: hypothetical protein ACFFDH_00635 [Promethearchaeota archaeon]